MSTAAYLQLPKTSELRFMGDTFTYFLATGERTGGAFALVDEQAKRGESGARHRHEGDVESFYVLEGEITFYLGDEPGVRVGPGAFVHVPGRLRTRLPDRVGVRALPDPHDTAPR